MGRNVDKKIEKMKCKCSCNMIEPKFEHKAALKWAVHWPITAAIRFLYLNFVYQAQVIIEP